MPVASLSPSRAGDFTTCPLLFRYRTVDRLPEESSPAAVRGTLVHRVLEEIFDLPATGRTPAAAHALLEPTWVELQQRDDDTRAVVDRLDEVERQAWLAGAHAALDRWFDLEDPTRLEPAERELWVEATLGSGLTLRGIVDRLDRAPDGALRVVDYKTGSSPRAGFEDRALFQLRLYALILWRSLGVVPSRLQLVYLGDGQLVTHDPDEADLLATERKVGAIWDAVVEARRTGVYEPRRSKMCDWCPHHAHCPVFGGTVLPLPSPAPAPASADAPDTAGPAGSDGSSGSSGWTAQVRRWWRRVRT